MEKVTIEELILSNAKTVAELVVITERTSKDVDKLTRHMEDSILQKEKVNQLEKAISDIRTHQDSHDKDSKTKWEILNPVITILRYPRATLLTVIGLYAIAIQEIRDTVLTLIRFF